MNETLQYYIRLTEIDALIVSINEQLAGYPRMLKELDAAEARYQKTIDAARGQWEEAVKTRRAAEREIESLREKIKNYHRQQSSVKTNKEYEALTHEMDLTRSKIDEQETIGLEKLGAEEEAAAKQKTAEQGLARLKQENAAERERIKGQIAEKTERMTAVQAERVQALEPLDEDLREEYEAANARHAGSVAAPLDGDHCGACGWQAVPHVRQGVQAGELIRCQNCRRYLYQK